MGGRRGPPSTPTAQLDLRGSRRADRPNEPRPPVKAPRCPRWLSKQARVAWREIVPHLVKLRVIAEIDRNALARYCTLWARWRRLALWLEEHGETYELTDDKGRPKCFQQRPEVSIVNKLSVLLLRLEQEFGLTPAARPRIHVDGDDRPADPLLDLLARRSHPAN